MAGAHEALQPFFLFLLPLMPPLTRTDTRASIFSWWSDSNSLLRYGPTINLHAAAKPLMKLMYHRQVKGFIRENKGSPLSAEMMEIYWSYLPYVDILHELVGGSDVVALGGTLFHGRQRPSFCGTSAAKFIDPRMICKWWWIHLVSHTSGKCLGRQTLQHGFHHASYCTDWHGMRAPYHTS
jgi:hypothetical protein